MRILIVTALVIGATSGALAQGYGYGTGSNLSGNYVSGHSRSDGSYVSGHYRSNPNNTQLDNWTTRGNTNPYTGSSGTRAPRW